MQAAPGLRSEPERTVEPEPEPEPELEPELEPRTIWLAPRVSSYEMGGDVSPSLASTTSPRAQTPSAELDVQRRDIPAEVARLATALRQEALRREAAETRLAAAEVAHHRGVEDAKAKQLEAAAMLAQSQQQHSMLRAQLTATATDLRRTGAREESLRVENDRLHGQVETLQLRIAAVSAERDRVLRKLSGSQALVDQAKAGEAAALKLASQKTASAQAALAAKSREVDEMASELNAARRCVRVAHSWQRCHVFDLINFFGLRFIHLFGGNRRVERAESDARTASATATEVSRQVRATTLTLSYCSCSTYVCTHGRIWLQLHTLRQRNLATAMKVNASQQPKTPVAPPALQNSVDASVCAQLDANSSLKASAHPD